MAVTSKTEIQNSALRKLRADSITSEDDDSERARLVKASYPLMLDRVQRSHPWNFCIDYVELASTTLPADQYDYDNIFQIPSNCLRILGTSLPDTAKWEEISGEYLVCNYSEIKVRYIKRITDVTKFDESFVEVLAWAIAQDICYAITKSASAMKEARENYMMSLAEARSYDAQTGFSKHRRVIADTFTNARRY